MARPCMRRDPEGLAQSQACEGRRHRPPPGRHRPCWRPARPARGALRSRRASGASSSVTPAEPSTTRTMRSASAMARSACSAAGPRRRSRGAGSRRCRPDRTADRSTSVSSSTRSRVTPGMSCGDRLAPPNSRFTSVDLPTFCRPTTAIAGPARRHGAHGPAPGPAPRRQRARPPRVCVDVEVGGVDHDGARRGLERVRLRRRVDRGACERLLHRTVGQRPRLVPLPDRRRARARGSATRKSLTGRRGRRPSRCLDPPSRRRPSPSRAAQTASGREPRGAGPRPRRCASTSRVRSASRANPRPRARRVRPVEPEPQPLDQRRRAPLVVDRLPAGEGRGGERSVHQSRC